MSEEQHTQDEEDLPGKHLDSGAETGGKCLNRHLADTPEQGEKKSCAHRWQSYLQMKGDQDVYNWAEGKTYDKLVKKKSRINTFATNGFPECYQKTLAQPKAGQWDVEASSVPIGGGWNGQTKRNFWWKCYHPYWHEAHHMVPNSTLRNAIVDFAKEAPKPDELIIKIRGGLLEEKYNLNEKLNMIMLPLDKEIADALGLPRHRQTVSHWNHAAYSNHVKGELKKILQALKQELVEHQSPTYSNLKDQIEALSKRLYPQIKKSSAASLDEMEASEFTVSQPIPTG
jgi:hypothetical protein